MIEDNDNFKVIAAAFPKIAAELKSLWGTPQFNVYLDDLEQDKTGRHRAGFSQDILTALLAIGDAHDKRFPDIVLQPTGKWIS